MTDMYAKEIERDAKAYVRERHLPRLIALWPGEAEDFSVAGTERIIARLRRLRAACAKMPFHHYDPNQHIAVCAALRAEERMLLDLRNTTMLANLVAAE